MDANVGLASCVSRFQLL